MEYFIGEAEAHELNEHVNNWAKLGWVLKFNPSILIKDPFGNTSWIYVMERKVEA